jgi:GNAT superfamily N-acetyltransferase
LSPWVAVEIDLDEEVIVGMAGLTRVEAPRDVPVPDFLVPWAQTARLTQVRVAPERQRRGIGRALTMTAIEWSREQGLIP